MIQLTLGPFPHNKKNVFGFQGWDVFLWKSSRLPILLDNKKTVEDADLKNIVCPQQRRPWIKFVEKFNMSNSRNSPRKDATV